MHVEVEQADLGVGDLRDRLAVDAQELHQRDEREAGGEDRRDVPQELEVVLAQALGRGVAEARRGQHWQCGAQHSQVMFVESVKSLL